MRHFRAKQFEPDTQRACRKLSRVSKLVFCSFVCHTLICWIGSTITYKLECPFTFRSSHLFSYIVLFVDPFVCVFVKFSHTTLLVCLSICLSVRLSVHLFICSSIPYQVSQVCAYIVVKQTTDSNLIVATQTHTQVSI